MSFVEFLTKEPLLVWAVLVFFVDVGLKSLHQHIVYIPRLFLLPVIMFILKSQDFCTTLFITLLSTLFLFVGAGIAMFCAYTTTAIFNKKACTVDLPGSPVTFIVLVAFFGIKFVIEYLKQNDPKFILDYIVVDTIISALFMGYFLGRALFFAYKCFRLKSV